MTTLELKPLGTMVGQSNNPARRSSIHGSLTMTMCPEVIHLVIRGTKSPPNPNEPSRPEEPGVSRTQSLMITDQTAILAPKRQDRIRIERSLADIWTKDVLPYPGMTQGKGENTIRTSAGSLMRRLSLHPAFSRRSSSLATTVTLRSVDTVCDIKADEGWEEKDGIEILLPPDGMEQKDDMEDGAGSSWSTSPTTTTTTSSTGRSGKKQRVYDVVEEFSEKSGTAVEVKPQRHHYLRKRWSASMLLLKTFSTGRNRRSLSPRA